MTTKTTSTSIPAHQRTGGETVRELFKTLVGLMLLAAGLVALAFWINPILGTITAFFVGFTWLFIAPVLAGRMVAALIIYFRGRKLRS